jgi:hypothetical protein
MNHYTIFAVRTQTDSNLKVKLIVDSVIRYTDEEIEKVQYAKSLTENKLFGVKNSLEALRLADMGHWSGVFRGLSLRANANMMTIHKFVTDFELDDESLDIFVEACTIDGESRKKLNAAKINI